MLAKINESLKHLTTCIKTESLLNMHDRNKITYVNHQTI
ncbi:hypothetical protein ACINWC743_2755 [Acinetobacter sp. WC-743]|nr:hypothetical protein ACINWC743_2755 [Acinetobacter sp. WC-743]